MKAPAIKSRNKYIKKITSDALTLKKLNLPF